jgi:hypothetical protein
LNTQLECGILNCADASLFNHTQKTKLSGSRDFALNVVHLRQSHGYNRVGSGDASLILEFIACSAPPKRCTSFALLFALTEITTSSGTM